MKQLLAENCINLDTVIFNLEGTPYTVKMFILLLKGQDAIKSTKKMMLELFGTRFEDNAKVLRFVKGVVHIALGIAISGTCKDTYEKGLEEHAKPLLEILRADVAISEDSQDFGRLKNRMPEIVNIVEMFCKYRNDSYSQTCAEFFAIYERIQLGVGDNKGASATRIVLNSYKNI